MITTVAIAPLAAVGTAVVIASDQIPPTERAALLSWLQARTYQDWTHETEAHKSAGPHPTEVVVYLNEFLDNSLRDGNEMHPRGAASANGRGWFWYEILGTEPGSRVVAADNGVPLCFGCHTPGKDFVSIPYPLQ